jgi:hypothetical protein
MSKYKNLHLVLFVVCFELLIQLIVIFVPPGAWIYSLLPWLLFNFLVHCVFLSAIIVCVLCLFRSKTYKLQEFFNLFILCSLVISIWLFETNRPTLEFFLFEDRMKLLVEMTKKKQLSFEKSDFDNGWGFQKVSIPGNFWPINSSETLVKDDQGDFFMFFPRNVLSTLDCGFLFSLTRKPLESMVLASSDGSGLVQKANFKRIRSNWFYGCFQFYWG